MIDELPEGWADAELGTVLGLVNGFAFKPAHWKKSGLPIIRIQNLNNPNAPFNYYDGELPAKVRVRKDDLLFAWSGTPGTSFGAHIWNGGDAWLNQHIFRVEFDPRLFDKEFLKHAINQNLSQYISQAHGGAGLAHITKGMFEESNLRFPPLVEQQRIVVKLDQLLAKIDSCQGRLTIVHNLLRRFRQSVLTAACTGQLTTDWREQNHDEADIDALLTTIRRRQELVVKTDTQAQKHRDVWGALEDNAADHLPVDWRFVKLNKLATSFDYGTSAKSKPSGKIPVLRMGNIQGGKIDWSNLAFTSDSKEITRYNLSPRTVLFNRTNSPELVGKTAIYRGERPAIFAGYLIRINTHPELDPEYLNLCLNTNYAREFCTNIKTDGVSQSNINAQKLGSFEVPFCTLAEQHEIVARVERLFALMDTIEVRHKIAQRQVNRLSQSILSKAFQGELASTEAEIAERERRAYESAGQLMQRIRSSHVALAPSDRKTSEKRTLNKK